jgi:hypothetical protein
LIEDFVFLHRNTQPINRMNRKFTLFSAFLLFLVFGFSGWSCQERVHESSSGEALVYQLWDHLKQKDVDAIKKMMASGFQSVHQFGANQMDAELKLIYDLDIQDYTITDLQITTADDLIVATYFVSVAETINGERLSKAPAPRMTVFVEVDDTWKWVAHANLKPIPAQSESPADTTKVMEGS